MFSDTIFEITQIIQETLYQAYPNIYREREVVKMLTSVILLGLSSDMGGNFPLSDEEYKKRKGIAKLRALRIYNKAMRTTTGDLF